jgi:hypothetical protein
MNVETSVRTEKNSCGCKKEETGADFQKALMDMMNSGNTQISVTKVSVTKASTGIQSSDAERETFKDLLERAKYIMDMMFIRNDFSRDEPVEMSWSYTHTEVTITGDREDIEEIKEMINSDEDVAELIKSVLEMAEGLINVAESLAFQGEYRGTDNIEEVLDRYGHLFGGAENNPVSILYGDSMDILSGGKVYAL